MLIFGQKADETVRRQGTKTFVTKRFPFRGWLTLLEDGSCNWTLETVEGNTIAGAEVESVEVALNAMETRALDEIKKFDWRPSAPVVGDAGATD